jgi:signal peptidase I
MKSIESSLISFTEMVLTRRKRDRYIRKERQKMLPPILDWLGAFLWAAGFVLLLNQFLFQAYVIPSRSMEKTLLVKDRLFVNKLVYGPELLPGFAKLKGFREPDKSEVIIFENPEYRSRGTLFDLTQRIIFMLTLSMVDLDKDATGNPAVHFLIKRAVGGDRDTIKFENGELYIQPFGEKEFIDEGRFKEISGYSYSTERKIDPDYYIDAYNYYKKNAYGEGFKTSNTLYQKLQGNSPQFDTYQCRALYGEFRSKSEPGEIDYYKMYSRYSNGIYIPENWLLPLGDNRDNSTDGRYFGPVKKDEVLGKASYKFWPLNRIGVVE